jgi:hypothetical protein
MDFCGEQPMINFPSHEPKPCNGTLHDPWHRVWSSQLRNVYKSEVKVTPVQALRLCTGRTAHTGSRGIALPFLDHDTRRGWGISVTPRPLFTPGKDPLPFVQEAGWAPGPVWTGAENLAWTGIRSPDRPAHSSVAIPTELPGPQVIQRRVVIPYRRFRTTSAPSS